VDFLSKFANPISSIAWRFPRLEFSVAIRLSYQPERSVQAWHLRCLGVLAWTLLFLGGTVPSVLADRPASTNGSDVSRMTQSTRAGKAAGTPQTASESRQAIRRGWQVLTTQALLPSDFSQEVFDDLWRSWPEAARRRAEQATLAERRQMTMHRYGLTRRPELRFEGDEVRFVMPDPASEKEEIATMSPMQYVVGEDGSWTMNCLACHGGSVLGQSFPGAPNNRYGLQSLTEEVRSTKFRLGRSLGRMELGSIFIPLGTTHGTTNAVVFGMGLMHFRDAELNVLDRSPGQFTHHDMDAPPWWHFRRKKYLYIDGFAEKGHRGLMQFMLVPENGPEFFRRHEQDFRDVYAFLSALRPPEYPFEIDRELADTGRAVFESHCARCHGTYGEQADYPELIVDIDDVGTDPVRHQALTPEGRRRYGASWFAHAGESDEQQTRLEPSGYVAPPLDGIWASAPYFHNGSVPTLWHVLHPGQRPTVWQHLDATSDPNREFAFDQEKVGVPHRVADRIPMENPDVAIRRTYFDTRRFGKSNAGHRYPDQLTEPQKHAVLEYLKTL